MYVVEAFKCKSCSEWLPPLPKNLCQDSVELECPNCKERRAYTHNELLGRIVAFTPAENPLYTRDMHWLHVKGLGLDFFVFVSENDPIALGIHSAVTALGVSH